MRLRATEVLPEDSTEDGQTDADLVSAVRRGEKSAFVAVMRRYNRLLFRAARGVIDNDDDAQDVVQESYLRAFTSIGNFRGESALGTWLARICINTALNVQRKKMRTVSLDEIPNADDTGVGGAMVSPHERSPDAHAERFELRGALESAIGQLPTIYRSVFLLRAVEQMSVADTALSLDISDDVVKTRYLRSRALLRRKLGERFADLLPSVYHFAGKKCDAVVAATLVELERRGVIVADGSVITAVSHSRRGSEG